jgi:hypothetical protein
LPPQDDQAEAPIPRQRQGRLDTTTKLRREVVSLYREARAGKLDPLSAWRLGSLLMLACRMIESSEIEERLAAVEERLAKGSKGR